MPRFNEITDNEKWEAVVKCNKDYDDVFFYGVKTTGIFCRPSCKSKMPKRKNVTFLENREDAIGAGFRPCKRCRPDEEIFNPDIELVEKAKKLLLFNCGNENDADFVSKQLGVSSNNLRRIFKRICGITLKQYTIKLRIRRSVELLEKSDLSILEIACRSGFNSLSNFYKCFNEEMNQTPNEYRDNVSKKKQRDI